MFLLARQSIGTSEGNTDRQPLPPERQEFSSSNREYLLVLSTPDKWKSRKPDAQFYKVQSGRPDKLLWATKLPQEYGPRFARVDDRGRVLLLDEWINVSSRYAIMILSNDGRLVAQYDLDSIAKQLGLPIHRLPEMAKYGAWISSLPVWLNPAGKASVQTAGSTLVIDLADGRLSVSGNL